MNKSYGKLVDGKIEYAPKALDTGGGIMMNPTAKSYLDAGWKQIVDEPPADKEGYHAQPSSWKETKKTIKRVYKMVENAASEGSGRVFSKLKLVTALKDADKWVLVKTWLEEKAYYDYYIAAQNFREDHPVFREALDAVKKYAGISDDEAERILAGCVCD